MTTVETGIAGGVSFALTAEQRELRTLAREFAEKEIRPKAAEYDEHQTHPADIIAKAHEVGLMNVHLPESLGGPELPCFDGMLVGEELNWGCSGIGTAICANGLAAGPILIAGSDEQQKQWLGPLVEEPILGCFGLSEPGAGSDVSGIQTTAAPRDGTSTCSTARRCSSRTAARRRGSSASPPRTAPRVTRGCRPSWCRWTPRESPSRSTSTRWVSARRTPLRSRFRTSSSRLRNRLGEEGDGFKIAMQTLDFTRPGTAVGGVGVAQAAYELSVDYAMERVQFGMPIAMNQGVSFLIADMATEIEASRLLCWQAAWMIDQGWGRKATKFSSFAKRFAADTAMKVTTDAVQVFGGYGYMKEYPVEKLMRDAKLFQIYEGTSQIQRLVIAKEIFLPSGA